MPRLDNGLERKKIVISLLWEDVAVLQGESKLNKGPINKKSAATLQWLNRHACVNCMGAQDDPCDFAKYVLKSSKVAEENTVTVTYIN